MIKGSCAELGASGRRRVLTTHCAELMSVKGGRRSRRGRVEEGIASFVSTVGAGALAHAKWRGQRVATSYKELQVARPWAHVGGSFTARAGCRPTRGALRPYVRKSVHSCARLRFQYM